MNRFESDLEEKLNIACEKGKQKMREEEERRIAEKALCKDKSNMAYLNRAFPYLTEEHLLESIMSLYPHLNEIFIVDLDQRDSDNIPLVKAKNFRPLTIHHSRSRYLRDCEADVQFKMLIAVIENGEVFIKSAQFRNSMYNR